jgi:hypothetical protein
MYFTWTYVRVSLFSFAITYVSAVLPSIFHSSLMSRAQSSSTYSNFQFILDNALKAYKERTKGDPLTYTLANQLEACDSASSVLTVLHEQVQELNGSQGNNTKWLDSTVNVLHAFSDSLGEGVGSVCTRTLSCPGSTLSCSFGRYPHLQR